MKISDVCQKTGLTRRAVRFYEEKGLIRPKSEDRNGRNFREYDDEDARRLSAVADLRKLEFSVDEISVMIDAPERIGGLVKERRLALAEEIRSKSEMLSVLEQLEEDIPEDIYALSRSAGRSLEKVPDKDIVPDFSRFETMTADEKEKAIQQFRDSQKKAGRKRRIIKIAALAALAALTVFVVVVGLSFIPRSIDITANGSYDGQGAAAGETVSLKGSLFTPLLFEPYFVGDISFREKAEYNAHCEAYIYPDFIDRSTEGFFYNLNENKTRCRLYIQGDRITLYISGGNAKNDSISIDISIENGKDITDAWLVTRGVDSEGMLYEKEELTFRAASD